MEGIKKSELGFSQCCPLTGGSGRKLKSREFHLNISKHLLYCESDSALAHDAQRREPGESVSLDTLKTQRGTVLSNLLWVASA